MRKHSVNFANVLVHFLNGGVLLDNAIDLVIPALTDDSLVRSVGKTKYFFYETTLEASSGVPGYENDPIITGRLVKDTVLTREQLFDRSKGLELSEGELRSSPSTLFVLILRTHKLIMFPETRHAPDFSAFQNTIKYCINRKRLNRIDQAYAESKEEGRGVTKRELNDIYPKFTVSVVPLTSNESVNQFIRRYAILKRVAFDVQEPNHEIDGSLLVRSAQRTLIDEMEGDTAKIEVAAKDGLNIDGASEVITEVTDTGNVDVRTDGLDDDGNQLRGSTDNFAVVTSLQDNDAARGEKVLAMLGKLRERYELSDAEPTELSDDHEEIIDQIKKLL